MSNEPNYLQNIFIRDQETAASFLATLDGCHAELRDYFPHSVGNQLISGEDDPVDLMPVINNLFGAGIANYLDKSNQIFALAIENSVALAEILNTALPREVMEIGGSASTKNRIFLNSLLGSPLADELPIKPKNYLEVGCHEGSTFIAALFGNTNLVEHSYVVDIFMHGENTEEKFLENCNNFLDDYPVNLFSEDCFKVDLQKFKEKIDVYNFDGPHAVLDHEKALTYNEPIFQDNIVVVVDDWNDFRVKLGTLRGLAKIDYEVIWFHEMPAQQHMASFGITDLRRVGLTSSSFPLLNGDGFGDVARWWNGTMVLALSKKR